ncbi:hypothetical protein LTS18_002536, partial [Coniosporium uncinatum]
MSVGTKTPSALEGDKLLALEWNVLDEPIPEHISDDWIRDNTQLIFGERTKLHMREGWSIELSPRAIHDILFQIHRAFMERLPGLELKGLH